MKGCQYVNTKHGHQVTSPIVWLQVLESDRTEPVFGICMGNQLTALAAGAKSYKLPLGNRSEGVKQGDIIG